MISDKKAVASVWATINKGRKPTVVRTYMTLMPNEALMHDGVTGEKYRGMGIGPFMVRRLAAALLSDHKVSRIVADVNVRNVASLRMMEKLGLEINQQVLYISAFGTLVIQKLVRQFV